MPATGIPVCEMPVIDLPVDACCIGMLVAGIPIPGMSVPASHWNVSGLGKCILAFRLWNDNAYVYSVVHIFGVNRKSL